MNPRDESAEREEEQALPNRLFASSAEKHCVPTSFGESSPVSTESFEQV